MEELLEVIEAEGAAAVAQIHEVLSLVQEVESSVVIGEGGDFATVEDWTAALPARTERHQRLHALLADLGYPPKYGEDNTGEWESALVAEVERLRARVARQ